MAVHVQECNLCGSHSLEPFAIRSDNIQVLRCITCGHGTVAVYPKDVSAFYQDGYYYGTSGDDVGYSDYQYMAEHGVTWAASLVRLLEPQGKVLDIGCADGHLLNCLRESHQGFGIEVNPRMANLCRDKGISIIGDDLLAPEVIERYRGEFDVVTAIAVFEHIPDFRESICTALELLRPEGVLLFEVPLISESHPSEIWFRSSLEHIHYPSQNSLEKLFESSLSLRLVGGECVVRDYGSTYIGIVRKTQDKVEADAELYQRVIRGPVGGLLTKKERQCRCWVELVHAASSDPELVALLTDLEPQDQTPNLWRRISQLWVNDGTRLIYQTNETRRVEKALANEGEFGVQLHQAISGLEAALEVEKQQGNSLHSALDANKVLVAQLQSDVEREKEYAERFREVISNLEIALEAERDREFRMQSALDAEKSQAAGLRGELQQEKHRLARLEMELELSLGRIKQLGEDLAAQTECVQDLRNSRSWRITGPLRWLASRVGTEH